MKTVRPFLNITWTPFISKLVVLVLKSQPVKYIFLWIKLRYRYKILYDLFKDMYKVFSGENIKKLESYKANKKEEFFLTPFVLRKVK